MPTKPLPPSGPSLLAANLTPDPETTAGRVVAVAQDIGKTSDNLAKEVQYWVDHAVFHTTRRLTGSLTDARGKPIADPARYLSDQSPAVRQLTKEFRKEWIVEVKQKYYTGIDAEFFTDPQVRKAYEEWQDPVSHHELCEAIKWTAGGGEPRTACEQAAKAILDARRARWEILAQRMGVEPPEGFRVFRGAKGEHQVECVLRAWLDTQSNAMQIPNAELNCWSFRSDVADRFSSRPNSYNTHDRDASVRYEALIPFEWTVMDSYLDQDLYVVYREEHELLVAAPAGAVTTPKRQAIVTFHDKAYTYNQRFELQRAWEAAHGPLEGVPRPTTVWGLRKGGGTP